MRERDIARARARARDGGREKTRERLANPKPEMRGAPGRQISYPRLYCPSSVLLSSTPPALLQVEYCNVVAEIADVVRMGRD